MAILAVEQHDGVFQVRLGPERLAPLRNGGQPVGEFAAGWAPRFVYDGFAPLFLLELRHDNGSETTWYLDANMNRLGGELGELGDADRAMLARGYAAQAGDPWPALLQDPEIGPAAGDGTARADVSKLNRHTAAGLQRLAPGGDRAELDWVGIADIAFGAAIPVGGSGLRLSPDHLRVLLTTPLQDQYLAGMAAGRLSFPSPITGRPAARVHSIYLDHMAMLYRCVDADHGLVFCIVAAGHHFETVGVLIPALHQVFYFTPLQRHFAETICANLTARIDAALRGSEGELRQYLAAGTEGFAAVLWGAGFHIGHHLWNELTGLDRMVATLPTANLPTVVVQGEPDAGEAYGAVDALFPELVGRVRRAVSDDAALRALAYGHRLQVMRVTGEHVSAGLRRRIMAQAQLQIGLEADHARIAELAGDRVPVVVLGLRVENRTLVDFPAFATRLVEHLLARLGRVAIVLDGHNGRADGSGSYPSYSESRAGSPPEQVEAAIAQALQAAFAGTGASIVDLVGRPVAAGLLWLEAAAFFVAPWGAGLAKYRWVGNKPGLILSSRWVLTQKGDLHIYDSERTMEAPTPVLFIDPADVFDLADEPVLVQVFEPHHPMYYNFMPSMNRVYRLIDQLLDDAGLAMVTA